MRELDAVVVGAGPAGSTTALVLARGGASVALVDKALSPRDKACGDLVGPRGLQVLGELGIDVPGALELGEMMVVGPTGRRVRLPVFPGVDYPPRAIALPRRTFDHLLREAALGAGAVPVRGRVGDLEQHDGAVRGVVLDDGTTLSAPVVIGADGATSRVAEAAGLVDRRRALWAFALRLYGDWSVDLPTIIFWEDEARRAIPGYAWLFPGPDGVTNVGIGIGVLGDRTKATSVTKLLPRFLAGLSRLGFPSRDGSAEGSTSTLGGWLKMGIDGTSPARGSVLLVGDAAGLVNPLQGEGIAHALTSGQAAALAILDGPAGAAASYRRSLETMHRRYMPGAAAVHRMMVGHPRVVGALGRVLTSAPVASRMAGGWSVYWNELTEGATDQRARRVARVATTASRLLPGGRRADWVRGDGGVT